MCCGDGRCPGSVYHADEWCEREWFAGDDEPITVIIDDEEGNL
jgi:hypothetical protein